LLGIVGRFGRFLPREFDRPMLGSDGNFLFPATRLPTPMPFMSAAPPLTLMMGSWNRYELPLTPPAGPVRPKRSSTVSTGVPPPPKKEAENET
jgi:hypothetical protein